MADVRLPDGLDVHARPCDCSYGFGPLEKCEREMAGRKCRAPEDHRIQPNDKIGDECMKVRRAVAAALLRAAADEHDNCCDECISSGHRKYDCRRNKSMRAQAAAIEAGGGEEKT